MKTKLLFILMVFAGTSLAQNAAPFGRLLERYYSTMSDQDEAIVWVYLQDKGVSAERDLALPQQTFLSERAIQRRQKALNTERVVDFQDLPLERSYVHAVANIVKKVRHEVKWFNVVSVVATREQIDRLRRLPFVSEIDLVGRFRPINPDVQTPAPPVEKEDPRVQPLYNYGNSYTQIHQISVDTVHNLGITG